MTADDMTDILERFRSAAMGMVDWSDALAAMTSVTNGRIGQLAVLNAGGDLLFNMIVGCSEEEQVAYYAAGGPDPALNPRTRALTMARPLHCITDDDFISPEMRDRSAIYTGLFRESDVPTCAMVRLDTTDGLCAALSIHRPAARGSVDPVETRFITALAPAISAVVTASIALGSAIDQASLVTAESLVGAAVMLGADMRIVAVSTDMETVLSAGTHVRMIRGRLVPTCQRAETELGRAFAMLSRDSANWHGAVPLTFPDAGQARPLIADLCPMPRRSSGPLSQARAMLVFRQPRTGMASTSNVLMTMFGLTQSEAEVGRLLAGGIQVADIAARRGTSLATVRSQIKAIFGKTGCNRQLDLSILLRPHCEPI